MLENVKDTDVTQVQNEASTLHRQGWRFVTMTCLDAGEAHEVLYHFDKDYVLQNLRLMLPRGAVLPSISGIYFAATLIENEIKDMFGLDIAGLAIDYKGRFLLAEDAPQTPMNKNCGMKVDIRAKKPAAAAAEGSAKS